MMTHSTEELDDFMKELDTFLLLNASKIRALDMEKLEDIKQEGESALADLKAAEREDWENSDDPHGYGDWRNDNAYVE